MVYSVVSILTRRNITSCNIKQLGLIKQQLPVLSCYIQSPSAVQTRHNSTEHFDRVQKVVKNTLSGKISVSELADIHKHVTREADIKKFLESPKPALTLGLAGLAPFVLPPLATVINGVTLDGLLFAQLAYGATILSFLGGISYGAAIVNNNVTACKLGWAVTPQLIGWSALLLPTPLGLLLSSAGIYTALVNDVLLEKYPQWFKSLRYVLTFGAIGSLMTSLLLLTVY